MRMKGKKGKGKICKRENVGLLAYSPLGFGVLSGKYLNGKIAIYQQNLCELLYYSRNAKKVANLFMINIS